jgi:hypothetical protein
MQMTEQARQPDEDVDNQAQPATEPYMEPNTQVPAQPNTDPSLEPNAQDYGHSATGNAPADEE